MQHWERMGRLVGALGAVLLHWAQQGSDESCF